MSEHPTAGMAVISSSGVITEITVSLEDMTGFKSEEVVGHSLIWLLAPEIDGDLLPEQRTSLSDALEWTRDTYVLRADGTQFPARITVSQSHDDVGRSKKSVALIEDLTKLKASERLNWQQANYDELTGLPNINMFLERFQQSIKLCESLSSQLGVLLIDLDNFKEINDTIGHAKGDAILVEVASRLAGYLPKSDLLARRGGDEFVVLKVELEDRDQLRRTAQDICDLLSEEYQMGRSKVFCSASIGITIFPNDGAGQDLLMLAEQSMYCAKGEGKNAFRFFTAEMQAAVQRSQKLTTDIRYALENNELLIFYQPIVDPITRKIMKAEALLRWQHPSLGLISPIEFIPIAEETGQIIPIGDWVVQSALSKALEWQQTEPDFQVSVNASPIQFSSSKEVLGWVSAIRECGADSGILALEITESFLMESGKDVLKLIEFMRESGITVSIDDFGTGYSSLGYLKSFDIDVLKIDRFFITSLVESGHDQIMCEAIIKLAHNLGIKVIVEGVETEHQLEILKGMGCDFMQGYLFSKPLPIDEFEARYFVT